MSVITTENSSLALDPELLSWIEETTGGTVVGTERRPGGGRREAWFIDVRDSDGELRPLFLRYDRVTPAAKGDPFTLHREAHFYEALDGTGVPVPRILGVHLTEQAILCTRMRGQTWFSHIQDEDERVSVARDFMHVLAALHRVDPHRVRHPDQIPHMDLRALVDHELDVWEGIYRSSDAGVDPLIEVSLRWLRRNRPEATEPVVIVQGDTGPGNFLYEHGKVTALLDLEMAHLGDPHDDLAWVSLRAVQEPFTDLRDRLADYAAQVPWALDLDRIRYYRVFAELRVVILGHRPRSERDPLSEVANSLTYGILHRRLLIEALADVLGLTIEAPPELAADPGAHDWVYHAILEQLREIIVPRSTDPFVIQRTKGIARLVKYLRQQDLCGTRAEREDLLDLASVLGHRPATRRDGMSELADRHERGELTDASVVAVLARQAARNTTMLRPVLGVLADRHFDPLD
ncbi:phosphotransferase family protein [Nocardia cyriacigeorgica]|uniref:phosphotransferase family protein n=1 Tax=Nocardia cyriacigeorgica TaxID=135487 RepID=UPI002456A35E|nr:phosphotransferase family protein [Nocardia cyriacigeorgica]